MPEICVPTSTVFFGFIVPVAATPWSIGPTKETSVFQYDSEEFSQK